jgi:molecular chaperone HtpG
VLLKRSTVISPKKWPINWLHCFKNDRKAFEEKWGDIGLFVKYGMISEEKFYDKGKDFVLLNNTQNEYFTLEEYKEKVKAAQTDKNDMLVYLYATDTDKQDTFIQSANKKGYDVLKPELSYRSSFHKPTGTETRKNIAEAG